MLTPPAVIVTFLFTDLEGSTRLWLRFPDEMRPALAVHDALLRDVFTAHDGYVFKTVGDAFCVAFDDAPRALTAAVAAQQAIASHPWPDNTPLRVRVALASGEVETRDNDYFGAVLSRVARLIGVGHGEQILVAQSTRQRISAPLPDGMALRSLGPHSLRDLQRPEPVYQLLHPTLPSHFSPLRSLGAFSHNLPLQLTSFIGRETQIVECEALLGSVRLLTLTGTGGCGKTRLALQVAAEVLEEFEHGVWLLELAGIRDPEQIAPALAAVLHVAEEPNRTLSESIFHALQNKQLLLIVDNCEHLLNACVHLADELLHRCPNVRLLATSREPLRIDGETTRRVPSLDLLGPAAPFERLAQCEAVRLFIERAQAALPSFALTRRNARPIAAICKRLDGIPLALELASRRVKAMPVEDISRQLSNCFRVLKDGNRAALPRQQTLRALIDWSYDLLDEQEKTLLARLSVFAGGWTLEAAETICADWPAPALLAASAATPLVETDANADANPLTGQAAMGTPDILDVLLRLVDKSLALYEEQSEGMARYRLLEVLRQYGAEKLAASGQAASWQARHADWYLTFTEQAEPLLTGPQQAQWLTRLEMEHDNLRAALTHTVDGEKRLRLATGLWRFWYVRGHFTEGRRWLEQALQEGTNAPAALCAKACNAAGVFALMQGDTDAAQNFYARSLQLYEVLGDERGTANTLNNLGLVAHRRGDYLDMQARLESCLPIYRRLDDQTRVSMVLNNLGVATKMQNDLAVSFRYLLESERLTRQLGDKSSLSDALHNLGEAASKLPDLAQAQLYYRESLMIRHDLGNANETARSLHSLGILAQQQNSVARATRLLAAAEAIRQSLGTPFSELEQNDYRLCRDALQSTLSDEAYAAFRLEGAAWSIQQAVTYALQADV